MNISKTAFKKYAKCNNYYPLEKIYYHQTRANEDEDLLEVIYKMFDAETGDDLINITDKQLEAMLEYYKKVEEFACKQACKTFNKPFNYYSETKDQTKFSYSTPNHTYYSYLDCYYEDNDEAYVIEVKATTNRKFLDLLSTVKKKEYRVFEKINTIIKPKKPLPIECEKAFKKLYNKDDEVGMYVYDIAIERYIIEKSLKLANKKVHYYLAVLNKDYIYDGNIEYSTVGGEELINFVDVTDLTSAYLNIIDDELNRIEQIIFKNERNPIYCEYCNVNKKNECQFAKVCFDNLKVQGSITELLGSKKVNGFDIPSLIKQGYYKITDLPFCWLEKKNHIVQYNSLLNDQEFIQKEKIQMLLDNIKYPIYHLDFEAFNCPIPRFKGERPYAQSLFQYSLHIEKEPGVCDEIYDNRYFLATSFQDQREELVKKLVADIDLSNSGSVMVYNESYEKTRLKELAVLFPEYKAQLDNINNHIIDLEKIVKNDKNFFLEKGYDKELAEVVNYYHPKLKGSYSIKKVLPVFTNRSYEGMNVANGCEAIAAYGAFKYSSNEEIEKIRQDLIKYCGLDTYSMVEILRGLRKVL